MTLPAAVHPLPVVSIVLEALILPWTARGDLVRLALVPAALSAILTLAESWISEGIFIAVVLNCLSLLPYVLFAVGWHRRVLRGSGVEFARTRPRWSLRETKFVVWTVVLGLGFMVLSLPFVAFAATSIDAVSSAAFAVITFPIWYVIGRSSLVLPAIAIDEVASVDRAWQLSQGNGWRLAILLGLVPSLVYQLLGAVTRDSLPPQLLWATLGYAVTAFEVGCLSLAYRSVTAPTGHA